MEELECEIDDVERVMRRGKFKGTSGNADSKARPSEWALYDNQPRILVSKVKYLRCPLEPHEELVFENRPPFQILIDPTEVSEILSVVNCVLCTFEGCWFYEESSLVGLEVISDRQHC